MTRPARKTPEQRLSNYIVSDSGCWEWQGAITGGGYGHISPLFGVSTTHRASYILHKGPIPDGLCILHSCDNKGCINPDHLRADTQRQNILESYARNPSHRRLGEQNARSILTQENVEQIRLDTRPQVRIAADYGVARSTIGEIKRGRNWQSREANVRAEKRL